jgi:ArsR family transcriptional regulator, arsenate/arsenite/antimonite-responsive transcriptional repressor
MKQAVSVAKALGHPIRLRILAMLAEGTPLCVCQMTSVLESATSTVSGHLKDLRRSGLVSEEKTGKLVYYRLDEDTEWAEMVRRTVGLVTDDERVLQDRALMQRVRRIPVTQLTQAGLKLERFGILRPPSGGR